MERESGRPLVANYLLLRRSYALPPTLSSQPALLGSIRIKTGRATAKVSKAASALLVSLFYYFLHNGALIHDSVLSGNVSESRRAGRLQK